MDHTVAWLLGFVFEVLFVLVGRLAVRALSLGFWRSEHLSEDEGRIYGAAGVLSFVRDGQRVVTRQGLFWIGMLVSVALLVALFLGISWPASKQALGMTEVGLVRLVVLFTA